MFLSSDFLECRTHNKVSGPAIAFFDARRNRARNLLEDHLDEAASDFFRVGCNALRKTMRTEKVEVLPYVWTQCEARTQLDHFATACYQTG
jgi:hypothetical protein